MALICISSFFFKKKRFLLLKNTYVFAYLCVCACQCLQRSEVANLLRLVLQAGARPDMDSGIQTLVPLSFPSKPLDLHFFNEPDLKNNSPTVPVCVYVFEPSGIHLETRTLYSLISEDLGQAKICIINSQVQKSKLKAKIK